MVYKLGENHDKNKEILFFYLCCTVLIINIVSLFIPIILIVNLVIIFLYIIVSKEEFIYRIIFFILPFATIMKLDVGQMTFTTVLMSLSVIIIIFKNLSVKHDYYRLFLTLCFISFLALFNNNTIGILKLFICLLFLYYCLRDLNDKKLRNLIITFTIAVIISSLFRVLGGNIARISELASVHQTWTSFGYITRFAGLEIDPNYYSVHVLISLSSLLVLRYKDMISDGMLYGLSIPLYVFGMLTLSKSFMLMFAIYIILMLFVTIKKKPIYTIVIIAMVLIGIVILSIFDLEKITFSVERLISSFEGFEINKILTGRYNIWTNYMDAITQSDRTLLFGHGLNAPYVNGKASHSAYIESLYRFGLIGSMLLILSIISITRYKRNSITISILRYTPLLFLLVLIGALDMVTSEKLFYYLIICVGSLYDFKSTEDDCIIRNMDTINKGKYFLSR